MGVMDRALATAPIKAEKYNPGDLMLNLRSLRSIDFAESC